eukprot:CCRYP_017355-RA/>CCRYP_017355-RA protein AED:0.34 eAED:0.67 QI:0/0/0/1/0/0/2/0/112
MLSIRLSITLKQNHLRSTKVHQASPRRTLEQPTSVREHHRHNPRSHQRPVGPLRTFLRHTRRSTRQIFPHLLRTQPTFMAITSHASEQRPKSTKLHLTYGLWLQSRYSHGIS